jgi:hypothetical protein
MKNNNICFMFALAFGLLITAVSSNARAGNVTVTPGTSVAGDPLFEFFLDTTGMIGSFDTIELILTSPAGTFNQVGAPATPLSQPSEDSGFSEFLTAPTNFGGQALSEFGLIDTTSEVSATHASLGNNSASTQGNYFLAQVVMSQGDGGVYQANFFDDGASTGSFNGVFGGGEVPEPGTITLAGLSLIGVFTSRRRRKS